MAQGIERDIRRPTGDIEHAGRAVGGERVGRECAHGEWNLLQIFFTESRGDDDLLEPCPIPTAFLRGKGLGLVSCQRSFLCDADRQSPGLEVGL